MRPAAQAIDAGEKAQVLLDAEVAVQRKFLRHIAQMLARLPELTLRSIPSTSALPEVGTSRPHIILKVVDFPAPLAEQAENFTALNLEIDMVGSGEITKLFVNDWASMTVSSFAAVNAMG